MSCGDIASDGVSCLSPSLQNFHYLPPGRLINYDTDSVIVPQLRITKYQRNTSIRNEVRIEKISFTEMKY